MEKATVEIARLFEEGERQAELERQRWEAQREQWRRKEEARRAAKALKDSKEELLQVIDAWAEARASAEFFSYWLPWLLHTGTLSNLSEFHQF